MQQSISRRKFLKAATVTVGAFTIVPRHVLGKGYTAPSDLITVGIIGCGRQSSGLSARFTTDADTQIVAASDVFSTKLEWFQQRVASLYAQHRGNSNYKGVKTYLEYEEMLERDDIDGIIVATPDHWHALPSIQAMKAGKDVFCEKPLSHTIQEGRAMVKAAEKYGRVLQTGSMQRSRKNFLHACELVRNGYVGEIKKVVVNVGDPAIAYDLEAESMPDNLNWDRWCGPSPLLAYHSQLAPSTNKIKYWPQWRKYKEYGGGILCDWGAHMFDIAQWGLGMDHTGPVEWIPPTDPKAVRGLKMIYENGVEMVHEDFGRGWGVRFIGTAGSLDISRQYLDSNPANIVSAQIKSGETRLYDSQENHYQDWVNAIRQRSKPICHAEVGHRSASICNIANIAYWLNRPLKWDPVKEKFDDRQANKLRKKKYRRGYKLKG